MKFSKPHWLTAVAATLGAVGGALLSANAFPAYRAAIGAFVAVCAVLAAPTITSPAAGITETKLP